VAIDLKELSRLERLGTEVSKRRITFKNGSYIEFRSADVQHRGMGAMGFGYNCIICLPKDEKVMTDRGEIKIGDIVEKKLDVKILSYDSEKDCLEYQPIEDYYKSKPKDLIEIQTKNRKLKLTSNHPVFVKGKGFIKAGELKEGDELCIMG